MSRPSRFSLFSPSAISASRYRPLTASAALFFFMGSQVVLPAVVAIDVAQADNRQPQSQKASASVATEASSTQANSAETNATEAKPKWSKGYQSLLDKNAAKWRVVQTQLRNNANNNKPNTAAKPNWNRNQVARTAPLIRVPSSKPGQVTVSQDNGACEDCVVDVRALDLSKVPSERDLRRAGQFGGALSPTRPAEPREVEARLDEILKKFGVAEGLKANLPKITRGGLLVELARKKAQRAKDINLDFGNAMQEWNKHNYREAAKMLEKHIEEYPESPWIGEAELHLGCDAKYNGRFAEAQERYESLLKATSEKPNREGDAQRLMRSQTPQIASQRMERDVKEIIANSANPEEAIEKADEMTDLSFDIHQKAKLRWADLDLAMGRFDNAAQKLGNIIRTDTDWRRVTWAQSWLHTTNFYKKNAKRLMACGPQALGFVMVAANQKKGADQVIKAVSPRDTGFNLAELQTLAKKNGLTMRGFKVSVKELNALTLPAILHYDFGTQPKLGNKTAGKGVLGKGVGVKGIGDERGSQSPFRAVGQNGTGHFVVLQKVDAKASTVRLFDPLEKRFYTLTYAQLQRQWSGKGLMLDVQKGDGQKNKDQKNLGQQTQIARLETRSMKAAVGGCCGIASAPDDLGDSPNNQECKSCGAGGSDGAGGAHMTKFGGGGGASVGNGGAMMIRAFSDQGEPVVEFNRSTLNMYVHDTPLWYQPAKGPAVGITISYNSRDGLNQNVAFGNKWAFRYGSYVVEDTAGRVTAFMEDGSQDNYTPNGSGGYNREVGNLTQLQKVSGTKYILHFQDGSQYVYEVPSGTTSLQVFLKEIIDPFGYKLTFTYNSSVQLTKITDALGQETTLVYDSNGKVTQVWDPFGRHASFSYNTGGNLIECIDMEGQAFQYTYDSVVRMTQINTAQGPWKFKHEGPDGIDNGSDPYPAENGVMWENMRVTVTNPANDKEEYYYDGYHGFAWYVNQNNYRPINAFPNNGSGDPYTTDYNEVRERYSFTTIDGMGNNGLTANTQSGRIVQITYPDGTTNNLQYDRDEAGYPLSTPQALPTKFYDARGKATFTTYNAQGQPLTVKDPKGNIITLTYATNGLDVVSVTNANSQTVATYTYNTKHQVLTATGRDGTTTYTYEAWGAPSTVTDPQSHVTAYFYNTLGQLTEVKYDGVTQGTFTYDAVGRVKTVTGVIDPNDLSKNLTVGYQYNNLDAVTKVTYPDGTTSEAEFTCCGIPGAVKDRSGRKTYYDYDVLKRPIRIQDAQGNTLKLDYDKVGNLVRLLDSKGNVTRWTYDKVNQLTAKLYHDNTGESYSYYLGMLTQTQSTRGKVVSYGYDDNSNLTSIDYASSGMADLSFTYNALDQVSQVVDGVGTHTFSYDNYGRLNGLDGPFTNDAQSFAYDTYQRLQSQSVERGASGGTQSQSYAYDALERLSTLTSNGTQGSGVFTYNYVGQTGSLSQLLLPNGAQVDHSYDALQRLTRVNNHTGTTNLADYKYSYDKRDIITEVQSKLDSDPLKQTNYTYDSVNQLVGEVASGGATGEAYSNAFLYDAMGNRTRLDNVKPGQTTVNKTAANALNQWSGIATSVNGGAVQSSTFTHDDSGNLSQVVADDGTKTLYSYDDLERLVSIEKRTAADVPVSKSEFLYDYASRKAKSKESDWNGTAWTPTDETWRVFDGLDVVQERNADNTVRAQYVRDGNIGGILSRTSASGHAYFHYDGNGNVTALSDATGALAGRYSYDAFGKTLGVTGAKALENPYRFSTKEYHAASGLYDYGYRFYSPGMGRWINRDPIRESGGINLYGMVGNNPVNSVDGYGLHEEAGWPYGYNPNPAYKPPVPREKILNFGHNEFWDPSLNDDGVLAVTPFPFDKIYYGPAWARRSPTVREGVRIHEKAHTQQPKWWPAWVKERRAYEKEKQWLQKTMKKKWPLASKFPNRSFGKDYDDCEFRLSEVKQYEKEYNIFNTR